MAHPLIERFVACLPSAAREAFPATDELEAELQALAEQAQRSRRERAAASGARASADAALLDVAQFVGAIAERLPEDATPRALAQVRADELELALACGDGDNEAISALDRRYFGEVEGALARLRLDRARLDEVKQTLRASLFVSGSDGKPPKIASYSGRGSLGRWLCVTAVRIELMARRGTKALSADDGLLAALPAGQDDPELEHLKSHYRDQFAEAFGRAMKALDDRQRNLLRQHYLDGLNIDRLGALYDVHRATAARWIARAREVLFDETRDALRAMLDVDSSTYESILRLIQSQLDLSIRSYLDDEK